MLYFAYGSNMDWDQMRQRCPSSRFVGLAVLRDYEVAFTRRSRDRKCGVADVVSQHGGTAWGVVYEIADLDIGKLDFKEGFNPGRDGNSYNRRECMVFLDEDKDRPLTVFAYFANPEKNPPPPSAEYMSQILKGARHWGLPAEHIRKLEQIVVSG